MKSFKFRFETLLKTKEIHVSEVLQELEGAKQELSSIEKKLKLLELEVNELKEQIHSIQNSPTSLYELEGAQIYFSSLQEKKISFQDERLRAENVCAQKKIAVENALKEKKIIEKLKEKQYKEWNEEVKKLEGKLVDEAAVAQFLRNSEAKEQ